MNNVKETLQQARSEAQVLHKKIEATTSKNHAAIRVDVQKAAEQAKSLAASLRTLAAAQRADGRQHLEDARTAFESVANEARDVASTSEAQLKATNLAMLRKAGDGLRELSRAVAAQRAAMVKR